MNAPHTSSRPWVVIPAYQAESTLAAVIERFRATGLSAELLVVDDGSCDRTGAVATRSGARVLRNETNRGYGGTQKRGIAHALEHGASCVAILHADGQYPPESLPELVKTLSDGSADVVLGSRMLDGGALRRGMPRVKFVANRLLTWFENRCYGLELSEYHTGMMGYSAEALARIPFRSVSDTFHFDGEMAMLAGRKGLRMHEVSVPHVYGDEESHLRPVRYGLTVLAIAISVRLGLYDRWLSARAERQDVRRESAPERLGRASV